MAVAEAIIVALELLRQPALVRSARKAPLPDGISLVLEIAAGDTAAIGQAARLTGHPEASIRQAAEFFIEQVLFDIDADSFRLLGLCANRDDPRQRRRHMALLARWLHPDVATSSNSGIDRTLFASRLTRAWQEVQREGWAPDQEHRMHRVVKPEISKETQPNSACAMAQLARATGREPNQSGSGKARFRRRHKRLVVRRLDADGLIARVWRLLMRHE